MSSSPTLLPINLATIPNISQSKLGHHQLAHFYYQCLYNLAITTTHGDRFVLPLTQNSCEACILGKQHCTPFSIASSTPTSSSLELIHSDLCGPLPYKSLTGLQYKLTFTDDYSYYSWIYFLAAKNETFEAFKSFRCMVENQLNQKLLCLRIDKGGEYFSAEFTAYCKLHGIREQLTATSTLQQNNIVEQKNRHFLETMHNLLFRANLPIYLGKKLCAQ